MEVLADCYNVHSTQSFWVYLNDIQQGMLAKYVNSCNKEEWSLFFDTCFQQYISSHESSNLTPFGLCLVMCYIANKLAWMFLEQCLSYYTYTSVDPDTCVCQLLKKNGQDVRRKQRGTHFSLRRSKRNKLYLCFKIQVDNYKTASSYLKLYFC